MHLLARAIIPGALIAVIVGLAMIANALLMWRDVGGASGLDRDVEEGEPAHLSEKIAVTLCGGVAVIGLVAVVQIIRYGQGSQPYRLLPILFAGALLILSLPAVLWRTRLRLLGEGVATIALAVASFLTGFSIGLLFVPLVLLMTWVCLRHLFHRFSRGHHHSSVATR